MLLLRLADSFVALYSLYVANTHIWFCFRFLRLKAKKKPETTFPHQIHVREIYTVGIQSY